MLILFAVPDLESAVRLLGNAQPPQSLLKSLKWISLAVWTVSRLSRRRIPSRRSITPTFAAQNISTTVQSPPAKESEELC